MKFVLPPETLVKQITLDFSSGCQQYVSLVNEIFVENSKSIKNWNTVPPVVNTTSFYKNIYTLDFSCHPHHILCSTNITQVNDFERHVDVCSDLLKSKLINKLFAYGLGFDADDNKDVKSIFYYRPIT